MPANRVSSNSPWHIILVLDDSGSMQDQPARDLNAATSAMLDELKLMSSGVKPYFKLSIIKFGSRPTVIAKAVSEQTLTNDQVSSIDGSSGMTNAAPALQEVVEILGKNPGKSTDFVPYVFFLSDGALDDEPEALRVGDSIKSLSIAAGAPRIVTIGFGAANDSSMTKLASTPELYKRLATSKDMVKLFPAIGTIASTATGTAAVDQAIINI